MFAPLVAYLLWFSLTWLALLAIGPFLLLCCQKEHCPTTAVVRNTCTNECRKSVHCTQNRSDMLQIIIDVRLHIEICIRIISLHRLLF